MDEFALIRKCFERRRRGKGEILGIGDDAALLAVTPGRELVAAVDTIVAGVHFPRGYPAGDVGYRALAVNLSDLAAMGAEPRFMTLALTHPDGDPRWVEAFAAGLFEAADAFDVALVGGDTTRGSEIVVTVSVLGESGAGEALRRSTASVGDAVYVSGHPGDAAAGLRLIDEPGDPDTQSLVERFRRPLPRVALGRALVSVASACIDLSDGLVADLGHLAAASGAAAELELDRLPLSAAITRRFDDAERLALGGGDDYELCFTVPPPRKARIAAIEAALGLPLTEVGEIVPGEGVRILRSGSATDVDVGGFDHFREIA